MTPSIDNGVDEGPVLDFEPTQPREDGDSPYLQCSIKPAINEHVEKAHAHALTWAVEMGLVRADSKKYIKFGKARFTWLAARAYPTVGLEELKLVADWIAFLFFYDDFCDTAESVEDGKLQQLLSAEDRLVAIVKNYGNDDANPNQEEGYGAIHHALVSICDRIAAKGAVVWLSKRLAYHLDEYIQGCRWERQLRIQGKTPTLSTYSKLRLIISAVYPCLDLAGICINPTQIDFVQHPLIQKLEMMANNHICWVNDIYGVDKEIKEGTTSNIVVVIANENNLLWKEAMDRAIVMCNKEVDAFVDLEACIHDLAGGTNGSLEDDTRAYIQALKSWMRGNYDWYLETGRYKKAIPPKESEAAADSNNLGDRPSRRSSSFVRQSWRLMGDLLEEDLKE